MEAGLRSVNRNPASHPRLFFPPLQKNYNPGYALGRSLRNCCRLPANVRTAARGGDGRGRGNYFRNPAAGATAAVPAVRLSVCLSVCYSRAVRMLLYRRLLLGCRCIVVLPPVCLPAWNYCSVGRARLQLPIATGTAPAQRERSSQH